MEENEKSKVYIKIDDRNRIIACEGGYTTGNIKDFSEWIFVEEGYGDRFNLCQSHYFEKPLTEEHGIPVYKYEKGVCLERTAGEIQRDIDAIPPEPPTPTERQEAQVLYTAVMTDTYIEERFPNDPHSPLFEKIKKFYNMGIYTREQVWQFVEKGKITEEEAREITGTVEV